MRRAPLTRNALLSLVCCLTALPGLAQPTIYFGEKDAAFVFDTRLRRTNGSTTTTVVAAGGSRQMMGLAIDETAGKVYWATMIDDRLYRADLDGSNRQVLGSPGVVGDLALDVPGGKLYYVDQDKIKRANLDGTGHEVVLTASDQLLGESGLAVDSQHDQLYWTDENNGTIKRANLDGSGVETLVTGLTDPCDIELDVAGGKMYWVNRSNGVWRANLDGTGAQQLASRTGGRGIALDLPNQKVYWTIEVSTFVDVDDAILRMDFDGSDPETLLTQSAAVVGIALHAGSGKVYWTEREGGSRLRRANLADLSAIESIFPVPDTPFSLALDPAGAHLYFTDTNARGLFRIGFDGTGLERLVTAVDAPGLALDLANGYLYFTDNGNDRVRRADLDGSNVVDLVTTGTTNPRKIALDVAGDRMYWTDFDSDAIHRAALDGSGATPLLTGQNDPRGIALDLTNGKLYWTSQGSGEVRRANLDGSGVETLLAVGTPRDVALDVPAGKLYVLDGANDRIVEAGLDGTGAQTFPVQLTSGMPDPVMDGFALIEATPREINVTGNNTTIVNGDTTPSGSDHTDFGNAHPDGGTVARTFTIRNAGGRPLTLGPGAVTLDDDTHFTVTTQPAETVARSGSTTFVVTFDPAATGPHAATVSIASDDADENPYTFAIQGAGAGFVVTETDGGTAVSEDGTTDTFTLVLTAQPGSNVVLSVTSGDPGEATVSPATVTFLPAEWNVPHTVTVTGAYDAVVDGDQTTPVTVSVVDASSADAFDGVADQTVSVVTTDNGETTLPAVVVTNADDSGAGSLRQAVADLVAVPSGVITFAGDLAGQTITLTTGAITLGKDLTIDASSLASPLTISGNDASRLFVVSSGRTVTLVALRLTGGRHASANGGAIDNAGTLTIRRCTVTGNTLTGIGRFGGGIYSTGSLTIEQSEVSGNTTGLLGYGGGIYQQSGILTLRNTTLSGNTAGSSASGGGVYLAAGTGLVMNNTTVTLNRISSSPSGAGGLHFAGAPGGGRSYAIANSIVAGNTGSANDPDVYGSQITSGGYNVVGVDGPNTDDWTGTDQTGTTGTPLSPLLGALTGSFLRYHPLQDESPAYNTGDPGAGCEAEDQLGTARPQQGRCDAGAVERAPALPVELVAFTATRDGDAVVLHWQTASETNNAGFHVEVQYANCEGRDGAAGGAAHTSGAACSSASQWEVLAFVEGHGTTARAQDYAYRAAGPPPGTHRFRLKQVDYDGTFAYSPEVEVMVVLAEAYRLSSAYPNPFNPQTTFTLAVREAQEVAVEVFDVLGRRVALLFDGVLEAGAAHAFRFDAGGLPSGLYVVRATGAAFRAVQHVTLVR